MYNYLQGVPTWAKWADSVDSRASRSGNLVHDAQWYDFATVLIPSKDILNNIDPVFD